MLESVKPLLQQEPGILLRLWVLKVPAGTPMPVKVTIACWKKCMSRFPSFKCLFLQKNAVEGRSWAGFYNAFAERSATMGELRAELGAEDLASANVNTCEVEKK